MSTPHKHAEYIKALAEGVSVDVRQVGSIFWHRLIHFFPFDDAGVEFRLTPHKWQAEIDAKKAGKTVQGREIGFDKVWMDDEHWMFSSTNMEYRIKPEMLRYRVGLFINLDDAPYTGTVDSEEEATDEEKNKDCFVRWLGDWQEVEA